MDFLTEYGKTLTRDAVLWGGESGGLVLMSEMSLGVSTEAGAGARLLASDEWPRAYIAEPSSELARGAAAINSSRLKRGIDIALAFVLLVALLPALSLIALAIALDSPGSPLFWQERYGRDRKLFWVCKFRTMRVAESRGSFTQARVGDQRVTRIGRLLRRTSIDELPQLLNVLMGDMSLVGPRPHPTPMDDLNAALVGNYSDRHLVRPGMTGLAQVHGHRGPTPTRAEISDRLADDREYIRNWSLWSDFKIIPKTLAALVHENAV